jgi:hypothetical protein
MPREISPDEINNLWHYEDGKLFWRDRHRRIRAGTEAGCVNLQGYRVLTYEGRQWKVHRLIYALHTGEWPLLVDHINGNRTDNRIYNLRPLTMAHNLANTNKSSGEIPLRGVSRTSNNNFRAFVQSNGVRKYLGRFPTAEEAHAAYNKEREAFNPNVIYAENN